MVARSRKFLFVFVRYDLQGMLMPLCGFIINYAVYITECRKFGYDWYKLKPADRQKKLFAKISNELVVSHLKWR